MTHVNDTVDLVEVLYPCYNRFFFIPCMYGSRNYIPFTPFDDFPLNSSHSPTNHEKSGE